MITIAVGLVMALYFKTIVDAFIDGVIMPIVSAIFGEDNFDDIGFGIGGATHRGRAGDPGDRSCSSSSPSFLFLIIKAYNTYVAKPKERRRPTRSCRLLTEIRDELRSAFDGADPLAGSPKRQSSAIGCRAQPPL